MMNDDHAEFLDRVRQNGIINMYAATPVLVAHFDLSEKEARTVLAEWMDSRSSPQ